MCRAQIRLSREPDFCMDQRGPSHPRLGCSKNLNMAQYNLPKKKCAKATLYQKPNIELLG